MGFVKNIILIMCALSMSGCLTIVDFQSDRRVFGGTQLTHEKYSEVNSDLELFGHILFDIIDLPLCIIADLVLLPVTVPASAESGDGEGGVTVYETGS